MRRRIKLTVLGALAAVFLTIGSYVALVAAAFFEPQSVTSKQHTVTSDYSRLEEARPAEVIVPVDDATAATLQLAGLIRRAAAEGHKISIAGSQHSMGGHTLVDGGWMIQMRTDAFRRIAPVQVREGRATVRVGSGTTWHELLLALDRDGWSVDVMQSNDDFTVGGSISVNCHGWNANSESIAATVEGFTLIRADGTIAECRRDRPEDQELFAAVCGGYGLLGIVTTVELRLVPNALYRAEEFSASASNYSERFRSLVLDSEPTIGFAYGRISVAPGPWFLDDARIIRFVRTSDSAAAPANTIADNGGAFGIPDTEIRLARAVFRASVGNRLGKLGRWAIERVYGQTHRTVSRNSILRTPSAWFANRDPEAVEILHEYFVPPERLAEFLDRARPILRPRDGSDLLNVTIRKVKRDSLTTLAYARADVFGLVMLFHYPATSAADTAMAAKTRKLVDAVLECDGSYYLPYRRHATVDQFRRAYPQWSRFMRVKQEHDSAGMFRNAFYSTYLAPEP